MQIWTLGAAKGTLADVYAGFAPYVDAFALPEPEQDLANVRLLIAKVNENG